MAVFSPHGVLPASSVGDAASPAKPLTLILPRFMLVLPGSSEMTREAPGWIVLSQITTESFVD